VRHVQQQQRWRREVLDCINTLLNGSHMSQGSESVNSPNSYDIYTRKYGVSDPTILHKKTAFFSTFLFLLVIYFGIFTRPAQSVTM
jgi:hypothetical protein